MAKIINKTIHIFTVLFFITALSSALLHVFAPVEVQAAQLDVSITSSDGADCSRINDGYFSFDDKDGSTMAFDAGTQITISASEPIRALYIKWYFAPDPWTLQVNGTEISCGQKGYVQEYIEIPEQSGDVTSVTMVLGNSAERLIDVYAFSDGPLPDFVHVWEDPYDKADVLLISTHADDEVLFFGGLIPTYVDKGGIRLQVAYFTDFFQSEPYRVQELLEGLWIMGLTHYPQLGEFYDNYSESYEEAAGQFDYDASLEYIVRTIRRFKPQVLIGQDPNNGEYGHGGHMWCARIIQDALAVTSDASVYPDSAAKYGTWEVPKVYFHLYPENQIVFDARVPLASFGGKTAIEIANEAYDAHWSQSSWMWFKVSDGLDPEFAEYGDELNCTKFGLYSTSVGEDTGLIDIMEHITPYDQQGSSAPADAAQAASQTVAEESLISDDTAQLPAEDAAQSDLTSDDTAGSADNIESSQVAGANTSISDINQNEAMVITSPDRKKSGINPLIILSIICAVIAVIAAIVFFLTVRQEKKRRRRRARRRSSGQNLRVR